MTRVILTPSQDEVRKWGMLAHVDATERERVLSLTAGDRKAAIAQIQKEMSRMKRKGKR